MLPLQCFTNLKGDLTVNMYVARKVVKEESATVIAVLLVLSTKGIWQTASQLGNPLIS